MKSNKKIGIKYIILLNLFVESIIFVLVYAFIDDHLNSMALVALLLVAPFVVTFNYLFIKLREKKKCSLFLLLTVAGLFVMVLGLLKNHENTTMYGVIILFLISIVAIIVEPISLIVNRIKHKDEQSEGFVTKFPENENTIPECVNTVNELQMSAVEEGNTDDHQLNNASVETAVPKEEKVMNHTLRYVQSDLLTPYEQKLYQLLDDYCVSHNFRIISKIRLADLISSPTNNYADFNRISRKHIDFAICSSENLQPYALIELDDRSHEREDRILRDDFVNKSLVNSGYKMIHVTHISENTINDINRIIYECNTAGVFYV